VIYIMRVVTKVYYKCTECKGASFRPREEVNVYKVCP